MLVFELSVPNLASIPNVSSISLQISTFLWSQILRGTFCNFVAMATAQNVMNWFYLQKCLKGVSLKSERLGLIP